LVSLHDLGVEASKLLGGFLQDLLLPCVFDFLKLISSLDLVVLVLIIFLLLQEFLDISEWSSDDVDEEVVHKVSVVSFECQVRWLSSHWKKNYTCIETCWTTSIFPIFLFVLLICNLARSVLMQQIIDVIVSFDIHLGCIKNVEIAHVQLDVSTSMRYWAFSCKNLGHVIILHISESFSVVLSSSAAKVMEILNQRENSSVHLH
jgi:hypothetical protein